ncbi:MAG: hypothetical protein QNJ54_37500 [Prochloraceae cyanobacterium]|nr:hypothetical protein [Prochloraceae cyanobacterium]
MNSLALRIRLTTFFSLFDNLIGGCHWGGRIEKKPLLPAFSLTDRFL